MGRRGDGLSLIRLAALRYPFSEVVYLALIHQVLHFQGPSEEDLALEAKA